MRFLLRFLGTLILAIGVVFAVGDIARYIADDVIRLATIGEVARLFQLDGGLTTSTTGAVVSRWPFCLTCGVVGAVLVLLGRKRRRIGEFA